MRNQCIYVGGRDISVVNFERGDIDTLKISHYEHEGAESNVTESFIEIVYANPGVLDKDVKTTVLLDLNPVRFLPKELSVETVNSLLGGLSENLQSPQIWLQSDDFKIGNVIAAIPVPERLYNFINRSFFPLKVKHCTMPIIDKWKSVNEVTRVNRINIHVEWTDHSFFICVMDKDLELLLCSEYSVVPTPENVLFYLVSTLNIFAGSDVEKTVYLYHKSGSIHDYLTRMLSKRRLEVIVPEIGYKDSFDDYVSTKNDIKLCIKAEMLYCKE